MDYEKIGLRCGIEIHQQLEGKKLFCSCPTDITEGEPDLEIMRRLRATSGETGVTDKAALHEQDRDKTFQYNFYNESCCLVDIDEEPPGSINGESVKTAAVVAKFLNARIVDEVQVMRKTVVDGSNTTGFQRTALIAMHGKIKTSFGEVAIDTICLEEDAAKIVKRGNSKDIYNLSRLGIPLIEIATGPHMKRPDEVRETAEYLGMILRSTGRCKRGLGTIRQDVNVSIKNGNRVEIKGAQDLRMITKIVEIEAGRQKKILEIMKGMKKIDRKITDLTDVFRKSKSTVIVSALRKKGIVLGVRLEGYAGYTGKEIQPGKRLGTDLSDYAKVKAGVGGIFHGDELPNYGIGESDVKDIKKALGCKKDDGFVIVADSKGKAKKALDAVIERINMLKKGIPSEVRKANRDGTTTYMRPMPGGSRMYPETDVVPFSMDIDIRMPELIADKAKRYTKLGLSDDLSQDISRSEYNHIFEKYISSKIKPGFIAEILVSFRAELARNHKGTDAGLITDEILIKIFDSLEKGNIAKSSVMDAIVDVAKGKKFDLSKYKTMSESELDEGIKNIVYANKGAPMGAVMGEVMRVYRGKADGKKISEIVKKYFI